MTTDIDIEADYRKEEFLGICCEDREPTGEEFIMALEVEMEFRERAESI